jgi:transposase
MGTRKDQEKREDIWIATSELARTPGHPFYQRLNELLDGEKFDEFVEGLCRKFYAPRYGRPSLAPGIYFRSLLIGYFEGIDSERGIAWRLADSLALRQFVRIGLTEQTPDHSTISRTRRLIDVETHGAVFGWVLGLLADRGLIQGKRVGIDATTLEANAAMRSIVRRDTGASYEEFLTGLAKASGMETPTREDLARLDRKRKKRTSNKEWKSPVDKDARIAKMKDGRTHLAHKAEHAVDLDTGAVMAVTLQQADKGDTTTLDLTLSEAGVAVAELAVREARQRPAEKPKVNVEGIEELVADKGYHSGAVLERVKENQVRSYIPERQQKGRRNWEGKAGQRQAVYANRQRVRGNYGKGLLRRRGELVERSFAHCYDTGGMRRTHLRKHDNILKRQLIHVGAFNLSLIFRRLLGAGTPREWYNLGKGLFLFLSALFTRQQGKIQLCREHSPAHRPILLAKSASPARPTHAADSLLAPRAAMALLGCPRGHRVGLKLRFLRAWLIPTEDTHPRSRALSAGESRIW